MNGTQIYDLLEAIAATRSKTEKEALVLSGMNEVDGFVWAVKAALDPFITYGIIPPRPDANDFPGELSLDAASAEVIRVLDELSSRQLTGNAAKDQVERLFASLDWKSAEVVWRVICKDLKAGFTEGTVNRVAPGTIAVFEVMLSHKFEEKRIKKWPVAAEPKKDGVRVIALVSGEAVKFVSRNGKEFPAMSHMAGPVAQMVHTAWQVARRDGLVEYSELLGGDHGPSLVLEGEMVSGNFNKTVGDVRRKSEQATDAVYCVFDALSMANFRVGKLVVPYNERRKFLEFVVGRAPFGSETVDLIEQRICKNIDEVQEYYAEVRARGEEGLIVKPLSGLYEQKRSYNWLKIKNESTEDLVITGAFAGEPNTKYEGMLGGVIVDYKGKYVRVGGGISDAQRSEWWKTYLNDLDLQEDRRETSLIGRLIEVEFHEVTPDGSLRHPRFVRFRDDKQKAAA